MKKKVLIVEDEEILLMINRRYLELLGFDVVATSDNGKDAIEAALEHNPDVILMDIRIEGDLDGIETAKIIQQKKNIPVIYITANTDEATKKRAEKTTMIGYFVKPINMLQLKDMLEKNSLLMLLAGASMIS